jgi:hypothetical protein
MKQENVFDKKSRVQSQVILSFVNGIWQFKQQVLQILAVHGITELEIKNTFPLQAFLESLDMIARIIGKNALFQIGLKIPEYAKYPEIIKKIENPSLDTIFSFMDEGFYLNHSGENLGHMHYEKTGNNTAKVICNDPYPCDFDMGILHALGQKFKPQDSTLKLEHVNSGCRNNGDDSCTYFISW